MNEGKKISLATYVISLIIMLAIIGVLVFLLLNGKEKNKDNTSNYSQKIETQVTNQNTSKNETIVNNTNTVKEADVKNSIEKQDSTAIIKELDDDEYLFVTDIAKKGDDYELKGSIYKICMLSENELQKIINQGNYNINGITYKIKTAQYEGLPEIKYIFVDNNDNATGFEVRINNGQYYLYNGEFNPLYKLTDTKTSITVDKKTTVENKGKTYTLENALKDENLKEVMINDIKNEFIIGGGPLYKFEFKNGKCSKILLIANGN